MEGEATSDLAGTPTCSTVVGLVPTAMHLAGPWEADRPDPWVVSDWVAAEQAPIEVPGAVQELVGRVALAHGSLPVDVVPDPDPGQHLDLVWRMAA